MVEKQKKQEHVKDPNGWVVAPLCVFCSKPWTHTMIEIEASASRGCSTCGYGGSIDGTITIHCEHCSRLVYSKEFSKDGL